jgi:uncharacterized protein with HEPN domain
MHAMRPPRSQISPVARPLAQLAKADPAIAHKVPNLRSIIAFRNLLIHGYAVVKPLRVRQIIENDLPALEAALAALLDDGAG